MIGGPIPSLACGNRSWTAWANTCAAECRMTLRPSSVSAATGTTSASASGTQLRSRSLPSASRTTTIASGAPRPGRPASRTAAAAVVPAGTRIGAAGAGCAGAVIDAVSMAFGCSKGPDHAIGMAIAEGLQPYGWPGLSRTNSASASVSTVSPSLNRPDTKIFRPSTRSTPRVDLQLLIDRDDLAVVDVKVRGALAGAAGDHPGRHAQDGVEQQPERPAVNGAVAAQMKPSEAGPALDPAVVSSAHLHRHRQDVAAVRQVHPAARRRRPLVGIERARAAPRPSRSGRPPR